MKTPHLLASFAVAATASAVVLENPSDVTRVWNDNLTSTQTLAGNLSLRGMSTLPPREFPPLQLPAFWDKPTDQARVPSWGRPAPRAPNRANPDSSAPETMSGSKPRGARPWLYGGETYWVTPLVPSPGK